MNTQQLQDRLDRMAEALPPPASTTVAELNQRVRSRRRRRRILLAAAAIPALVLAGVIATGLLPPGPSAPVIAPVDAPEAGLELSEEAMWTSPPVTGPAEAARVFADRVLDWDDPTIRLGTQEPGPVWVTFTGPRDRRIGALFTPTTDTNVWQVLRVGPGLGPIAYDPIVIEIDLPVPAETASADLFVRYDDRTWALSLDSNQARDGRVDLTAHGLPPGATPISGLVLYRDSAGGTVAAAGGPLDTHGADDGAPEAVTGRETILELDVDGTPRRMVVWGTADGSVCIALSGMSCIVPPSTNQMMGPRLSSHSSGAGQPTIECEYGAVHPDVADVQLHFPDGTVAEAQVADASGEVGGRYYAHCWTGERPYPTIVLFNAEGRELHRRSP